MPVCCCSSRSRSRICACTVTSSAVVGSSAISRSGSQASAMAIITRWRMPPDIWCGYSSKRRSGAGMRTRCSAAMARLAQRAGRGGAVVRAHRLGDLIADGEHRVQAGHRLLEDHRDAVAADVAHLRRRQVEQVPAVEHDLPGGDAAGRRHQAHHGQRQHRLAAAGLADDAEGAAAIDRDVHAIHRGDVAAGGAEHGAETGDGQQRVLPPPLRGRVGGEGRGRPLPPTPKAVLSVAHAVRNVGGEICSAVR